mmetsp:Transcript_11979/g.27716  ORF Transcript_11979/g.27716 Transcript_11979/m.27716 type:complete len:304 (-) Transcript_11979:140-1051(-)
MEEDEAALNEALMLKSLGGSVVNTLRLRDLFEEPTHFYIVTDYAAGGDLLNRVVKEQPLTEGEAKQMARSLLNGVRSIHGQMICHRNLTPENIFFRDSRATPVVVGDFGSATRMWMNNDTGEVYPLTERCSTSSFTAPEILLRSPYDSQSDMWSVGAIVYFALVGYKPFEDMDKKALFQKIVKADYTFQGKAWQHISRNAKRFISSLLHTDPLVRMTAEEALEHPWLADVHPRPPTIPPGNSSLYPQKVGRQRNGGVGKLSNVWKALNFTGKHKDGGCDEDTLTSQTASVGSSEADGGIHKRG